MHADADDIRPPSLQGPPVQREPFWRTIYQYVRPHRRQLLISALCAMVVGAVAALQPLTIKWMIDDGVLLKGPDGQLAPLPERMRHAVAVVGFFVLLCAARLTFGVYGHRRLVTGVEQFLCDLRGGFFRHVQQLCFRFHDQVSSGELFNYIMGSPVQSLKTFLHQGALVIPIQAVSWCVALVALGSFNLPMTAITVATVAGVVWANGRSRRVIQEMSAGFMETESQVSKYVADMLRGCRAIKVYAMEDNVSHSFQGQIHRIRDTGVQLGFRRHFEFAKMEGVHYLGMSAVFLTGIWFCLYGGMEVGTFLAFNASLGLLMAPLMNLMELNLVRANAEAGLSRINRILRLEKSTPELPAESRAAVDLQARQARERGLPCVEFDNVTFAYDPGRPVLHTIACRIPDGQSVALVGPSGSGKTSFASLMLRLYDPTSGIIRLNGADLATYSLQKLRAAFGVVPQDPYIFQATIRDNIRVTRPDATEAEIRRAMDLAYASEFIDELPDGLDTVVGEGGSNLSGGQRQRLAIARAILTGADYFIFDEATSALDNNSERRIQQAMEALMDGRTSFVIAHRLTTIRNVKRILVFNEGRIVQDGTYAELSQTDGLFRDMLASAAFVRFE
ncbi:MAG: ABC transporter ATP-binding protein [Planctomycetes bacterium]|nr:ABC transporter ATP-binding protein [Planctomycetota bacterium]